MDDADCLTEVLDQWIKFIMSGLPTWKELSDNLNRIGEKELAAQLLTVYQTGEYSVYHFVGAWLSIVFFA